MAGSESIDIYVFGSYLREPSTSRDIDFLLIHGEISVSSALVALKAKGKLLERYSWGHVTVLSKIEEEQLNFVLLSGAVPVAVASALVLDSETWIVEVSRFLDAVRVNQ